MGNRRVRRPKFTGIKRGYAAIFVKEPHPTNFDDLSRHRIRMLDSDGIWRWCYAAEDLRRWSAWDPCWLDRKQKSVRQQVRRMRAYDRIDLSKTYFLGYVKED